MLAPGPVAGNSLVLGKTNWRDPRDVARAIRQLFDMRGLKNELEARTARNIAFLEGRQMFEWSDSRRRMVLPAKYNNVADFLIYNIIKPLIYQKIAKVFRKEPVWTVPAFTSDEWDQMVARFSNDLMHYYYQHGLAMGDKVETLVRWVSTSPVAFLQPTWDATKGDLIHVTLDDFFREIPEDTGQDEANQMRREDVDAFRNLLGFSESEGDRQTVAQYTGDVDVFVRSIFKVMWYPFFIEEWDQVHAYLITEVMSPEEVAHRYRLPINKVIQWRNASEVQLQKDRMIHGWTSPYIDTPTLPIDMDNGVLVHQLWVDNVIAPQTQGIHAVLIGSSPVVNRLGRGLGNALNRLPIYPVVEHPGQDTAWGTCSIDDAIPAQVDLNDARTQQGRWRREKVTPKIVRQKTDGGNVSALRGNDRVYEIDDINLRPQILAEPTEGIEAERETAFNLRYIHDALSVPDVSLGRTGETQARSGKAVIALQQEAAERLKVIGKALNTALRGVGSFILAELQQKAIDKRLTPIPGNNNAIEYTAWSRANLRPTIYAQNPSSVAIVTVDTFTNIPTTPAEMQNTVLALLELQAIPPQEQMRIVTEIFGLHSVKGVLDRGRIGRDKAEMKVQRWRRGEVIQRLPTETDDHESAIPIIEAFINTDDFKLVAQQAPLVGQEVLQHLEAHKQARFDVQAMDLMRRQFAQMRAAALFTLKAQQSGLIGAARLFALQANGGIGNTSEVQSQQRTEDADKKAEQEREDGQMERNRPRSEPPRKANTRREQRRNKERDNVAV